MGVGGWAPGPRLPEARGGRAHRRSFAWGAGGPGSVGVRGLSQAAARGGLRARPRTHPPPPRLRGRPQILAKAWGSFNLWGWRPPPNPDLESRGHRPPCLWGGAQEHAGRPTPDQSPPRA